VSKKIEYLAVLLITIAISALTSYATTLSLHPTSQNEQPKVSSQPSSSPQATQQPSNSPELTPLLTSSPENTTKPSTPETTPQPAYHKITLSNTVKIHLGIESMVNVYSNVSLHNLTIVYQYTTLNGTSVTTEVGYGDYYPVWGWGAVVEPGATPSETCGIPGSIISACSRTKNVHSTDLFGRDIETLTLDVYPQLNVTEVYGYS
jgi:hypothetical protein